MTMYKNLMTVCAAVVLAFGLAACGSSDDDSTAEAPAVEMPEPTPDPVPTDLEATQTAAAAAATAAGEASANAAASASSAADATATLATLQTGADSNAAEMGGNEAAYAAHAAASEAADAASAAAAASVAAAAATTGDAAEDAWRDAVAARDAAVAAEATAMAMSEAAIAAAMTELHIDGTMKMAGESSLDAASGMLTNADGTITGTQLGNPVLDAVTTRTTAMRPGRLFSTGTAAGPADDVSYRQAVQAGTLVLGKVVDTSDDKARLTIITAHEDEKTVRVFVDGNDTDDLLGGLLLANVADDPDNNGQPLSEVQTVSVKSIGLYYEAMHTPAAAAVGDNLAPFIQHGATM